MLAANQRFDAAYFTFLTHCERAARTSLDSLSSELITQTEASLFDYTGKCLPNQNAMAAIIVAITKKASIRETDGRQSASVMYV
jgi:hypothetical protein